MTQKIYTVMGATGHIGHCIVEDLLKRGHIVRAVGRDARKLHQLEIKGAIPISLAVTDSDKLAEAFKGAYAIFTLIPLALEQEDFGVYQDRVGEAICQAIQKAHVTRVVNLSSVGADLAEGTGPVKGLHRQEERLNALKNLTFLVHLRPHYFMENLYRLMPMIQEGVIRSSLSPDLAFSMVATRDIGWKAVGFLENTAPSLRVVFDFVGPRPVTMNEVTALCGQLFDNPELRYEQVSFDQERSLFKGLNPKSVDLMIEMERGFNNGLFKTTQPLTLEHHGATNIDTFLEMFAHRTLVRA